MLSDNRIYVITYWNSEHTLFSEAQQYFSKIIFHLQNICPDHDDDVVDVQDVGVICANNSPTTNNVECVLPSPQRK